MNSVKKKICFIVSSPETAKAFLKYPIKALAKNYTIYLVANASGNILLDLELPLIKVHSIRIERNIRPYHDLKALWRLILFFKNNRFDFIHSVSPKAGLLAMCSGYFTRTPIRIHTFTGQVWYTKKGVFRFLLKTIDRLIVRFSTNILVDGESQKEFLIEQNIIKNHRANVLGKGSICGINTDIYAPDIQKQLNFRKEHSILEGEIVLMFLGRLNSDKGVPDLLMAFKKLKIQFPNVKLYLIGPDEEKIEATFIKENRLPKDVFFKGYISNPKELLQGADIFCLPSYREGFGMSVIEASALEKAVICSNTYGLRDTVVENITGLKHNVADIDDLFIKLKVLVEDPQKIKQMGKAGRIYVKENFEQTKIIDAWEKFYRNFT